MVFSWFFHPMVSSKLDHLDLKLQLVYGHDLDTGWVAGEPPRVAWLCKTTISDGSAVIEQFAKWKRARL